jgi:hypothetical protein
LTGESATPKFFSLRYHTAFFPTVLRERLSRRRRTEGGTTFTSTLEMMVCLAICAIRALIGIPSAVSHESMAGWVMSILGVGGIIALLVVSIGAQWGYRPSYDAFLAGVFSFFVLLGLFIGVPVGMESHSFWIGAATSIAGVVAGYIAGIFAGLWLQRLGWFAVVVDLAAAFGAVVIAGAGLVMVVLITTR